MEKGVAYKKCTMCQGLQLCESLWHAVIPLPHNYSICDVSEQIYQKGCYDGEKIFMSRLTWENKKIKKYFHKLNYLGILDKLQYGYVGLIVLNLLLLLSP